MDSQTYPGQGLSIPQLVFALKQEVRRAAYSPSYSLDRLSQLDQDITTISAAIREWRNSLVPINRLPEDILSLIPTHLSAHGDRLRSSFVCLHWRRTFLRRAELWSQLSLWNGDDCVKTYLERSKGSTLDVSISHGIFVSTMKLLSPHTERIGSLYFLFTKWVEVQEFSEINSGPLPLLHTLEISVVEESELGSFDTIKTPSLPLFSNATRLKEFYFYSDTKRSPPINHFIFPNLVLFDFSIQPSEVFHASSLLDFLEASPTLRTIHVRITADISLEDAPQGRVVALPNVETFDLLMNDGGPGYKLAAHISCPSARCTTITQRDEDPEEAFPTSNSWDAIVRQYMRNPADEVTLEIRTTPAFACKLTFQSPGPTIIELNFRISLDDEDEDEFDLRSAEALQEVFLQATLLIRNHPQLDSVKRLRICHSFNFLFPLSIPHIANEAGRLFKALGPLDELTIYHCDIRPYFHSFLNALGGGTVEPVVFPSIKQLTISYPLYLYDRQCTAAIVGLAKLQHALGIPFERVIICRGNMPAGMEEELGPWVGSVEYRSDPLPRL